MKNSEIAEATAEVLERYGWVSGHWGNRDEGFCLLGAGFEAWCQTGNLVVEEWEWSLLPGLPAVTFSVANVLAVRNAVVFVNDGLLDSKEKAIEVCMKAAKHWRDRGE